MILYENRHSGIDVMYKEGFTFLPHVHNALELIICTAGEFCVSCNFRTETLHPGDAMIAFSHDVHAYHQDNGGTGILIIVNPNALPLFSARLKSRKYDNYRLARDPELVSFANAIYKEFSHNNRTDLLVGYLHLILGTILQDLPYRPITDQITSQDSFTKILTYLSDHYTEPLSLESLAQKFGINHSHLSRTFATKLSCGYLEYIHQLRIEYAKNLLSETQNKISDVAFECGFTDQRSFNRVFKKLVNMTPKEYRQSIGRPTQE